MTLTIQTLSALQILLDGQEVGEQFRTDKERALLLYLALNPERAHRRDVLAELLWPERPVGTARTNLRQALYGVRRVLGDQTAERPFLVTSGDSLQINPQAEIELDTNVFNELVRAVQQHNHGEEQLCSQCITRLEQALKLYRGEFLEGLFLGESLEFQEWLQLQRERYQREYLLVLELLIQASRQNQNIPRAVDLARRLVAVNPLDESSHRLLMRSLAVSGRRGLALEQFQDCRTIMLEELGVEPSQETREVYENIRDGSIQERRKKTGPLRRRTNLPGQLTAFVGRKRELAWFELCLQKPECRLITIAGMSGIGKTRLAFEVCRRHIAGFKDGVWYVPVESMHTTEQLVYSLGSTLGLHFEETDAQRDQLVNFLAHLEALVLLDGFENLVPTTDLLIDILKRSPGIKFMVTTRVRLEYQSVCILELQGLEYPHNGALDEATQQPAVELFLSRARRAQPAFELNDQSLSDVVRICQLVEGHPLAIELAASGLRARTCQQVLRDIQTNLDSLETQHQDIPVRHRSLRAALDHVWVGLPESEQRTLVQLSIFNGKFSLAAAQEITGSNIQMLSGLVGKSLLFQDAANYFWLQLLVRTYLQEILLADAELEQQLRARYSRYYINFIQQRAEGLIKGHTLCQLLEELEREVDHIHQAWVYAVQMEDWEALLPAVEGVMNYFDVRGNLPEGRRWFASLVASLTIPLMIEETSSELHLLAGLAFGTLGWFDFRMGRLAEAYENLLESCRWFEQITPRRFPELYIRGRTGALNQLGFAAAALGDYDRAGEFFQQALDFALEVQDKRAQAYARLYLAELTVTTLAAEETERIYGESLRVFSQVQDHRGAVRALINLGDSAFQQGENEKALRFYQTAHERVGALDSGWAAAALLLKQAAVAHAQGSLDQAIGFTERSLEIYQEIGDLRRMSAALNQLAGLFLSRRQFSKAVIYQEQALQLAVDVGAAPPVLACLVEIGYGFCLSAAVDTAQQIFQQVLAHPAATQAERRTAPRRLGASPCDSDIDQEGDIVDTAYLDSPVLKKIVSRLLIGKPLISGDVLDGSIQPMSQKKPDFLQE